MKPLSYKCSLRSDWYGVLVNPPLTYEVQITSDNILTFCSTLPWIPTKIAPVKCGDYVEGLREYDVTELFLALSNGSYVEFNFAANGAWWFMEFSSYRAPNRSKSYSSLTTPSIVPTIERGKWSIKATCNLSKLFSSEILSLNCTAIQQGKIVKYFGLNAIASIEPDFHHLQSYKLL